MKRRDFLINSTLFAGGLKLHGSSVLNSNVPSESTNKYDFKSTPVTLGEDDLTYRCSSMPEGYFELLPQEAVRYSKFPVSTKQADSGVRSDQAFGIRLWHQFGRGAGSLVQNLEWTGPDTLFLQLPSGIYSTNAGSDFQVLEKTEHTFDLTGGKDKIPEVLKNAHPPARQGRWFKSRISAWTRWDKYSWIIGTDDGCIALYHEKTKTTYALGAIGVHGPVHQIAVANGNAYGVSGDPNDLGNLFHYSDKTGLREIGRTVITPDKDPIFCNTQPIRVAVSPDGDRVAVSVADLLGCVYIFKSVKVSDLW